MVQGRRVRNFALMMRNTATRSQSSVTPLLVEVEVLVAGVTSVCRVGSRSLTASAVPSMIAVDERTCAA